MLLVSVDMFFQQILWVFLDVQDSIKTTDCMEINMRVASCDLKVLCYVNVMYMKKICTKFWFLIGDFPRSPSPVRGFWKSPRAARRALGDFQNPLRAQGIWVKIPSQKPEFSIYIPNARREFENPREFGNFPRAKPEGNFKIHEDFQIHDGRGNYRQIHERNPNIW